MRGQDTSILFSGGREHGEKRWEPEPYELPLHVPAHSDPPRQAPPRCDDEELPEKGSRVIVIDLC